MHVFAGNAFEQQLLCRFLLSVGPLRIELILDENCHFSDIYLEGNMSETFHVDKKKLSFNDDDVHELFIMQSTFYNINTQNIEETVNFLGGFGDVSFNKLDGSSLAYEVNKMKLKKYTNTGIIFQD